MVTKYNLDPSRLNFKKHYPVLAKHLSALRDSGILSGYMILYSILVADQSVLRKTVLELS